MPHDFTSVSHDDGELDCNPSNNPSISEIAAKRLSRRSMLRGFSAVSVAMFGSTALSGCFDDGDETPPSISAGSNGTTSSGRLAMLSGVATDDSPIKTYEWVQTGGPAVTLEGANTSTASFLAPSVTAATPSAFTFKVTDIYGNTTSKDTQVTVNPAQLGFSAVAKNLNDIVTVPEGYNVTVLYRMGDPLTAGTAAYANNGADGNFAARAGDQHDGMAYFGLGTGAARDDASNTRGLLVMNHENIVPAYLHPAGPTSSGGVRPEAEAIKEIEAHGVSTVEVVATNGAWSYVQNSSLNRRVTPNTPVTFSGPVAGSALLRTRYSANGTQGRGTINNCANGRTPWATYLTCEENWAGYFRRSAGDAALRTAAQNTSLARYGISEGAGGGNGWATVTPADPASTVFARWNITVNAAAAADGSGDFRNEANQMGWVVEIDPYDPAAIPKKRTALGRMGHEGCWPSLLVAGRRPAFYMGDDNRNDYFYKFVSNTPWATADASSASRMAMGDKYLDAGVLYVARFDANGTGVWRPLTHGQNGLTSANATYPFADQADVLVNTRLAADVLGATKMDRPEWAAVNPKNGEVYLTLTNTNTSRAFTATDAANPRWYNDPKGATNQRGNPNGHIIRLRETGDSSEATTFTWDIYAFGAGADLDATNINLSGLDATNDFSSPDGLWFSRPTNAAGLVNPLLWIQTDDGAFTDVTNNQMLAAIPGAVGDGAARTITNTDAGGVTRTQATIAGRAPGTTMRRFLVGPKQCEITGIDSTPDGRTLFVNIQHPGEDGTAAAPGSNWPASQAGGAPATSRPRSATVVITKVDGGVVGL